MKRLMPHIALVLVFTFTPAGAELTENLLHLLVTGHAAHAVDDEQHRAHDAEHGCSGSFHTCGCHRTPSLITPRAPRPPDSNTPPEACAAPPRGGPADGHLRTIFRPPRRA